jgi:hypothetical protein
MCQTVPRNDRECSQEQPQGFLGALLLLGTTRTVPRNSCGKWHVHRNTGQPNLSEIPARMRSLTEKTKMATDARDGNET